LELDIFSPAKADFELFIAAVRPLASTEFTKDLNEAPPFKTESELLVEARELFNSERYWESHEILEGIWRQKQGEEKSLLQGIILLCAAFVHHQKGEQSVALGVLKRAVRQLEFSQSSYGGFPVGKLRKESEEILRTKHFSDLRV
jgi:predicted metal-dependent hydrolase